MQYPFDIILLLLGLMVLSGPGIIWSFIFFEKISLLERIMFGVILGFSFIIGSFFLLDMLLGLPLTQAKLQILVLIYWLVGGMVFALSRYYYRIRSDSDPLHLPNLDLVGKEKTLLLLFITISVFVIGLLPHITGNYFLPLHVDEWEHWKLTDTIMKTGSSSFVNPYLGAGSIRDLESGHHYLTAAWIWLTGASFQTVFVYGPALIVAISSILGFIIGENHKEKFGLIAAIFVPLIPTTCRYMGPSFFVPVALGLVFMLTVIWFIQLKSWWSILILPGILWCVFLLHPPTALACIITAFFGMIMLIFERKYLQGIIGLIISLLPIVGVFALSTRWDATLDQVVNAFIYGMNLGFNYNLPRILVQFGYMSILIWILAIIGVFAAFAHGSMATRTMSLSAMAFMAIIMLYDRFGYGIVIMYERSFLYIFLMVALLGAWGLVWLSRWSIELTKNYYDKLSQKKWNLIHKALPAIIVLFILASAIPAQMDIPYYHMISNSEYEEFQWLSGEVESLKQENVTLERGIIDPYKASPFSAVTGLYIISSSMSPTYGYSRHEAVLDFLINGCINQSFLDQYDIDVVYATNCENENLTSIYDNIYLVNSSVS